MATAIAVTLSGCSSGSNTASEVENPVVVCADKGIGPTHADYENCFENTCPYRKLDSSVAVMQTAEHRLSNDATKLLDRSADRRVLA